MSGSNAKLDIAFAVKGERMPLDHGYALYGAISRLLEGPGKPWLHESHEVGIHAIRGRFAGRGVLALTSRSELVIRAPEDWIDRFLPLAGQGVEIEGHAIELGFPVTRGLVPTTALYAHRVTTRNGQDEARFDAEIARRLSEEGIRGRPVRGPRRVFRVRDKRVVAHALLISELDANESLWLQERGLGGRRKLGCGVFLPWTP